MFGNFFKPTPYNVFNYKPRYYDERKERIENLKKKYQNKSEISETLEISSNIKITKNYLKNEWAKHKKNDSNWGYNLRLALIITILFAIAAYLLDIHSLF